MRRPVICCRSRIPRNAARPHILPALCVVIPVHRRPDAPWGPHSHVTLYVFGCFCRLTTVQRKKGSGFCRRRVITWAASHREGGLLHQSRRQGQRLSDQAKLTRTAEGTKRGTEGAWELRCTRHWRQQDPREGLWRPRREDRTILKKKCSGPACARWACVGHTSIVSEACVAPTLCYHWTGLLLMSASAFMKVCFIFFIQGIVSSLTDEQEKSN